jgi:hypothetical protein
MRKGVARLSRAAVLAMTVAAAACGGFMAVAAAPAAAHDGSGALGRLAPFGHGRTMRGPWDSGWREGTPPAPTLNGYWAPVNRCPVDDPAMLAADGVQNIVACLAVSSPSGAIKIGALALPIGESDTQFGLVVESHPETETFKLISPDGGATSMAPIEIPDGLPALVCPGAGRELWWICGGRHAGFHGDGRLTDIDASVQQAGELSGFSLVGALSAGVSIVTEPIEIHLQNPLLGPACYIGSESEPILLQFENLTQPSPPGLEGFEDFEVNGNPIERGPLVRLATHSSSGGDLSFAVPGASGCGFRGMLDSVIDHNAGLPSPAGENALTLNEDSTYAVLMSNPEEVAPNEGKVVSQDWHSAIVGGSHGHWHH